MPSTTYETTAEAGRGGQVRAERTREAHLREIGRLQHRADEVHRQENSQSEHHELPHELGGAGDRGGVDAEDVLDVFRRGEAKRPRDQVDQDDVRVLERRGKSATTHNEMLHRLLHAGRNQEGHQEQDEEHEENVLHQELVVVGDRGGQRGRLEGRLIAQRLHQEFCRNVTECGGRRVCSRRKEEFCDARGTALQGHRNERGALWPGRFRSDRSRAP